MAKIDAKWLDEVWEKIDKKLQKTAITAREKLPYTTVDGRWEDMTGKDVNWWTNGFWGGTMWLMYDATGNEEYKKTAIRSEELLDGALKRIDELHHDVGFMWHLTAGANYRLTGDKNAYVRNMYAANILAGRFNSKAGYIRAWNDHEKAGDRSGYAIIDCMMNIPLLYWASKETKDDRYKYIAMAHADKTLKYHLREDGSVNHIVNYDPVTGDVVEVLAGQGWAADSSWSRGQSWGLYGFTLSYIHTKEKRYLDAAKKIANYFIAACCDDYLPKCDFRSPEEPVYYDSSASMIAACGLIELSKLLDENEGRIYLNAAINLVKAAVEKHADFSDDSDAILHNGTVAYHFGEKNFDMVYCDYYFVEAISKLKGFDTFLW